jgi:hypothetical protein
MAGATSEMQITPVLHGLSPSSNRPHSAWRRALRRLGPAVEEVAVSEHASASNATRQGRHDVPAREHRVINAGSSRHGLPGLSGVVDTMALPCLVMVSAPSQSGSDLPAGGRLGSRVCWPHPGLPAWRRGGRAGSWLAAGPGCQSFSDWAGAGLFIGVTKGASGIGTGADQVRRELSVAAREVGPLGGVAASRREAAASRQARACRLPGPEPRLVQHEEEYGEMRAAGQPPVGAAQGLAMPTPAP